MAKLALDLLLIAALLLPFAFAKDIASFPRIFNSKSYAKLLDFQDFGDKLVLFNPHVRAVLSLDPPYLSSLQGDFIGTSRFGVESLAQEGGYRLEREDADGTLHVSEQSRAELDVIVRRNDSSGVVVTVGNITEGLVSETWTLSLGPNDRHLSLSIEGSAIDGAAKGKYVRAIRHGLYLEALSVTGLFPGSGTQQMKNGPPGADFFAHRVGSGGVEGVRVYALGGGSSVDAAFDKAGTVAAILLLSSTSGKPYWSGFQSVEVGNYSNFAKWDGGWEGKPSVLLDGDEAWSLALQLAPNDRNFPVLGLSHAADNLPEDDLAALLTGAYGTSPGCLCTYPGAVKEGEALGQIATTIANPGRGYSGTYNYFDPDNFISLSALIYSGDAFLLDEARRVIERSGEFLKANGQLPHHFVDDKPTFTALSGATQTGPNTFWTKAALSYARNAEGGLEWLRKYMPKLRLAASFCFDLIDPKVNLLKAPGSLMIDVFIRNNYTSDSNAMVVGFLRDFADAESVLGNHTGAAALRAQADLVSRAMEDLLWNGDDHYLTQRNPDNTTRDFVDYDANLIAVAHGIGDTERIEKVLARVDSGRCSSSKGAGPQFVSEKWYGPGVRLSLSLSLSLSLLLQ